MIHKKSLKGIFNHANLTGIKRPCFAPSTSLNPGSCVQSMIGYTPHVCHHPTQGQGFNKSKQREEAAVLQLTLSLFWRLCNALESPLEPYSPKLCSMDAAGHFGKWNGLQKVLLNYFDVFLVTSIQIAEYLQIPYIFLLSQNTVSGCTYQR